MKSTMISPRLSLSLLDESAMNLFYEIKKKDGRTKRRRLVKRDNNNEASVIQEGSSTTRGVYSPAQNSQQNVVFGNVPESQLPFFASQATHDSNIAEGSSKKRKSMDVSHSASSKAIDVDSGDEATTRPPGVKASKARSKKPIDDAKDYEEFQSMWSMKKEDLTIKKELSKIKLLETLIGKEGPLADYEETLKKKLINELGYN
ncbi:hypothetical protein Bca4012_044523 [Brassica carinata]|uniref:Uncharacterized protein n=1 Tax=Brassica carinata TaxID=52824 RepID=A0A8X7UD86_BRACI|nr:hypothetical protein Bca52824_057985 [Brassica carinata]